ncbi:DUF2147 domain-containing protein [Rhodalgimonas zhirmunskyi]|uniref:DUF2147 domain-containing protein n=1 Tax=Rhodalgimonas zhirmunskyi TaxID=2964767 RepID=A0AAJ1X732_9RHOB|nr:DUF2147 domain-containing protein [Rhodoalgimonas zhirmunskyi]MDQ2095289.1 DUF2147 domain-containing protein [Rhodoalgimonas zhirmunskyi]
MKKVLALAAGLAMAAGAALADPAEGMWKTEVDDGSYAHVKMAKCGANICGTIARTFKTSGEYDSPNKGKQLVMGMKPQGGGSYAGKVWRPSNDKIYVGKMNVNGNTLVLKGCVAGGLLCSGQTWTRVK